VKCSLVYMDFEGRSDGRSVKSVIAHVAPLKLVCDFNSTYSFLYLHGFRFYTVTFNLRMLLSGAYSFFLHTCCYTSP